LARRNKKEPENQRISKAKLQSLSGNAARLYELGFTEQNALGLTTKLDGENFNISAEAIEGFGIHLLEKVDVKQWPEVMGFVRHRRWRTTGLEGPVILSYWRFYRNLNASLDDESASMAVTVEVARAGLPPKHIQATSECYRFMSGEMRAKASRAAQWIARLGQQGIPPSTFLSAVNGNARAIVKVRKVLGEVKLPEPEQDQDKGTLSQLDVKKDLTDENVGYRLESAVGGGINRLDLLQYQFGLKKVPTREGGTELKKEKGGRFTGYFKPESKADLEYGFHKGTESGIPEKNPGFIKRSIATYKLDQILGAGVIPPTFLVKHRGKTGILMQEVEGFTKKQVTKDDATVEQKKLFEQAKVQKGMANLYILDYIAGQVDRHSKNVMITRDGEVRGIDNDLAFGATYNHMAYAIAGKVVHHIPDLDKSFDEEFARRIIEVNAGRTDDLRSALNGLISEVEIAAMLRRLDRLAKALDEYMKGGGRKVFEKLQGQTLPNK